MHPVFLSAGQSVTTIPITFVNAATWPATRERLDVRSSKFVAAAGFEPKAGQHLLLPAEDAARALAQRHGAQLRAVVGDDLVTQNFPLIHAVGRAAARAPRLIDLIWGDASHPKVTLIGKGVCFDSGGLDIKPESGMLNMKKDMGGAACMLALAHMLMARGIGLRLRVIIPAVENAISGAAFRPRDVYRSRK